MGDKLLSCPFCGGEATKGMEDDGYWQLGCSSPSCPGCRGRQFGYRNLEGAMHHWNRRAGAEARELERVKQALKDEVNCMDDVW